MADEAYEDGSFWNDQSRDYKADFVEAKRLAEECSKTGWIYIGVDTEKPGRAKIGMTAHELNTRDSSTGNTDFELLCAFKVKHGADGDTIKGIESATKEMLDGHFERRCHGSTGRKSEWYNADPGEFRQLVNDYLSAEHGHHLNSYHCSDREIEVIMGWENDKLIHGEARKPYEVSDVSNPPVSFECLMPGGCGEDCDCW